jgi:hypothetical protein
VRVSAMDVGEVRDRQDRLHTGSLEGLWRPATVLR